MEGYQTVRQLSFGILDMAWHGQSPEGIDNVEEFEDMIMEKTNLFPKVEGTNMSVAFSHIFQGGYSSGYYSYKWAEVLDADAFEYFKEKGIFNKEVATAFFIGNFANNTKAGIIKKPPPAPTIPVMAPTIIPSAMISG